MKLDKEETELLRSYEAGEWQSVENMDAISNMEEIAGNTLKKNKRINIRLSERDLNGLKTKAALEGIPYQTFVSSILHKYLAGRLEESK
jgi:predicted DNA binding CopG/RHH family protein